MPEARGCLHFPQSIAFGFGRSGNEAMRPCVQFRMAFTAITLHRGVGQDNEANKEVETCELGAPLLNTEERQVHDAKLESGLDRLRARRWVLREQQRRPEEAPCAQCCRSAAALTGRTGKATS